MNEYPKNEMLVEAEGLVKIYRGRQVVRGVSINVRAGEVVGLFGPNGAGKTTSFYMVMGLVRPDGGSVKFRGVDVTDMPMYLRARMGMGYLAQEPSIFRKLTVEENIMAILQTLDISGRERKERCEALMEDLGLTKLRHQKAMTLSGGERRRLEITRAMVTNPAFIMLDEPFSGVDPLAVSNVRDIILRLKDERNLGILITDHNVSDALKVVDRAYLMADGKVLVEGTSDYLINDPEAQKVYFGDSFKL
ncbi:MAG: LPS export ABC transporter ATP-binding protein [Lentisphaeria bacterium]|nr:LPS export ABC transporter ATP-binding protein [Lentisphaeria bacterium]